MHCCLLKQRVWMMVTNAIMRLFLLLVRAEVGAVDMPMSLWKVLLRQISFILPQDFYRTMITC